MYADELIILDERSGKKMSDSSNEMGKSPLWFSKQQAQQQKKEIRLLNFISYLFVEATI